MDDPLCSPAQKLPGCLPTTQSLCLVCVCGYRSNLPRLYVATELFPSPDASWFSSSGSVRRSSLRVACCGWPHRQSPELPQVANGPCAFSIDQPTPTQVLSSVLAGFATAPPPGPNAPTGAYATTGGSEWAWPDWAGPGRGPPTHRGSWNISRGYAHAEAKVATMVSASVADLTALND